MTKEEARKKAEALVARMTLEERAAQLVFAAPAIERLGINEYNWWNECSHGVARAGTATVFPHAIALAASFDEDLLREIGDVVSTEARVKYNTHVRYGDRGIYKGLTFWAPNINIFRDPRWGRGQETYGEDPFLTATLGTAYIKGLQGEGEFLKAAACSKHYAVHSGPEGQRHEFNAECDAHDLWETYLPAFEKTVKAGVAGVMGAYNRTNGEPCCSHSELLVKILRGKWGFDGYVTSDCGAIRDIYKGHWYTETAEEAAAVALKATCDLNCGYVYESLMGAYESDLITEEDITAAAVNLFTIRYRLGEFEEKRPWADLSPKLLDCAAHRALNLRSAEESVVLLKNDGILPLSPDTDRRIAVVGPNAMSVVALEGNYNGTASQYVTVADGVRATFLNADICVEAGGWINTERRNEWHRVSSSLKSDGIATAASADLTVLCLGLDRGVEGEETRQDNDYTKSGDKARLFLPPAQQALAEAICDVCPNVIVVLLCGSSVDVSEKVRNHARAILHAWYPGALGGLAVAHVLSGEVSPSGKLPVTIYDGNDKLPDFIDYSMKGRTYRYLDHAPLYPFGFGLSYTSFGYEDFRVTAADADTVTVAVTVRNTGKREGYEKAQIYARYTDSRTRTPNFQLCGTKAVFLAAGEAKELTFTLDRYWLSAVLEDGTRTAPDGGITLFAGGHQPDEKSTALTGTECLSLSL